MRRVSLFKKKEVKTTINAINLQSSGEKTIIKVLNVLLIIIVICTIMISVDYINVKKYKKGPYFAIPLITYNDGGTKVYYGLGYKVIKYKQKVGRRDMVIGSWFMSYSASPTVATPIDLALTFRDNPDASYKKFKGRFVKITATLEETNLDSNEALIKYQDPDGGNYTLDIICKMAKGEDVINNIVGSEVTVIGTIDKYSVQTNTSPNKLTIKDAFIE